MYKQSIFLTTKTKTLVKMYDNAYKYANWNHLPFLKYFVTILTFQN